MVSKCRERFVPLCFENPHQCLLYVIWILLTLSSSYIWVCRQILWKIIEIEGRTLWISIERNNLFRLIENKFKLTEYSTIDIARRLLFLYDFFPHQLRIQYQMTIYFLIETESSV